MFNTHSIVRIVVLLLPACVASETKDFEWTTTCNSQHELCECKISENGQKVVECTNSSFTGIPENVSAETQVFDLSNNIITELKKDAFSLAGLTNLEILIARGCSIELVDKDAFRHLKILAKLDLSNNNIHELFFGTFHHTFCLREIILNGNPVQTLQTGLFGSTKSLRVVKLGGCHISHIEPKTFCDNITELDLDLIGNRLSNIDPKVFHSISGSLHLDIRNNPWRCDCNLRPFKLMLEKRRINYTQTVSCTEPPNMMNKSWSETNSDEFVCSPHVHYAALNSKINGGEMVSSTNTIIDYNNNVFIDLCYKLYVILVFVAIGLISLMSVILFIFYSVLCFCKSCLKKRCCNSIT